MSRKAIFALASLLICATAGFGAASPTVDCGVQTVPVWAPTEGTLTPGAPFIIYLGDRDGRPLTLVDAGLLPEPGAPDVVRGVPRAPGAQLFLRSGDTVVPIPPPARDVVLRRPIESLGRLVRSDLGNVTLPTGIVVLGYNPHGLGMADGLPYLVSPRTPRGGGKQAAKPSRDAVAKRIPPNLGDWLRFLCPSGHCVSLGNNPDGVGIAPDTPFTRWSRDMGTDDDTFWSPLGTRDVPPMARFPTHLVQPGGMTSLGTGDAITDGDRGQGFDRYPRKPDGKQAAKPNRDAVAKRIPPNLGRWIGNLCPDADCVSLGNNPDGVGIAPDTPFTRWSRDMGTHDDDTFWNPFGTRDVPPMARFPTHLVQPGGLTSLGQGGTVTDGTTGHDFGRLGQAPPLTPPGDTLPREAPGIIRMPAPPDSGAGLDNGVGVFVFLGNAPLLSFTDDTR